MTRLEIRYKFKNSRNYKLITPCCNKINKDGQFANYIGLPDNYGYCHSCGKLSSPSAIYKNENGIEFIWDDDLKTFKPLNAYDEISKKKTQVSRVKPIQEKKRQNYISESTIWRFFYIEPENNLLKYLREQYGDNKVQEAKEMYVIGTCEQGGTIFWSINKDLKVQKSKISFYSNKGKRTNRFKVPYKNENEYYSCLFGEHLLIDELKHNRNQIIVLVESEKTAIVGSIKLPKYTWLAYGGLNGLTDEKIRCLIGYKVLIIPDISNRAVRVMDSKIEYLRTMGIDVNLWDMTEGKSDVELKYEGIYNNDLEDIFRSLGEAS
jgi:hypothetical protein